MRGPTAADIKCAPSRLSIVAYGCDADEASMFRSLAPSYDVAPVISSRAIEPAAVISADGCRCVTVSHRTPVGKAEFHKLRRVGVEYVCTRSIGVDHIDLAAAAEVGITVEGVTYAPDAVADFTVMLILMVLRRAKELVLSVDQHDLRGPLRGRDLRDLTVGVVGAGAIGRAVIRRLGGFGCELLASTKDLTSRLPVPSVTLDELLRRSDVVTLHVPLNPDTHHLIGRSEIERMKPGAILVNTARGAVVDNDALVAAMEADRLGGLALDVIEGEQGIFYVDHSGAEIPHAVLRRLGKLPNALVTPHTSYATHSSLQETIERTLAGCLRFEKRRSASRAGHGFQREGQALA